MEELRGLHVDRPEPLTAELPDEAIEGTVRWFKDCQRRGEKVGTGLLITRLRQGGNAGYGSKPVRQEPWWQTSKGRWGWIERNVSDLDPQYAETAVISLTQRKVEPIEDLVREWAVVCEKEQSEHDRACHEAVRIQNKAYRDRREPERKAA